MIDTIVPVTSAPHDVVVTPASPPRTHVPPATGERRRPGRIENASPELIALMRKPTPAARVRVALYDAPNFILRPQARRPPSRHSVLHMTVALTACSAVSAVALKAMLVFWG